MSDTPPKYRTICTCSHDKASHYEQTYGCLAARCSCSKYVDELGPKPKAVEEPEVVTREDIHYAYGDYHGLDYDDIYGKPGDDDDPPASWY